MVELLEALRGLVFREREYLVEVVYEDADGELVSHRGLYMAMGRGAARERAVDHICFDVAYRMVGYRGIKVVRVDRCESH